MRGHPGAFSGGVQRCLQGFVKTFLLDPRPDLRITLRFIPYIPKVTEKEKFDGTKTPQQSAMFRTGCYTWNRSEHDAAKKGNIITAERSGESPRTSPWGRAWRALYVTFVTVIHAVIALMLQERQQRRVALGHRYECPYVRYQRMHVESEDAAPRGPTVHP